jgi:hypothetical protein
MNGSNVTISIFIIQQELRVRHGLSIAYEISLICYFGEVVGWVE